jgi:hypothetical protein
MQPFSILFMVQVHIKSRAVRSFHRADITGRCKQDRSFFYLVQLFIGPDHFADLMGNPLLYFVRRILVAAVGDRNRNMRCIIDRYVYILYMIFFADLVAEVERFFHFCTEIARCKYQYCNDGQYIFFHRSCFNESIKNLKNRI